MPVSENGSKARVFSLELDSDSDLKRVNIPYGAKRVLIEGTIGVLKRAELLENSVLEMVGTKGTLRVDFSGEDFAKSLRGRSDEEKP